MVTVRLAAPTDAAAVADVYVAARTAAGDAIPPAVHTAPEVRAWIADVVLPTKEVWLAIEEQVDGILVLHDAELEMLYVHPRSQRTGLGSTLLAHAKVLRPGGLALWTFESNLPARRFYEDRCFTAVRRTDDNEEHAPDLRYVWGAHSERSKAR